MAEQCQLVSIKVVAVSHAVQPERTLRDVPQARRGHDQADDQN